MLLMAAAVLPPVFPAWGQTAPLTESGRIVVEGRATAYLIRHLPVSSFPELPAAVQGELNRRGCVIPQTYEAHQPENVVHGSFERAGSQDWAVLCSAEGTVTLLLFFGDSAGKPAVLGTAAETERLQLHDGSGVLGFNWGIDTATPEQVHDAQSAMLHRPVRLDHDALADSLVDRHTVYHFYLKTAWIALEMQD